MMLTKDINIGPNYSGHDLHDLSVLLRAFVETTEKMIDREQCTPLYATFMKTYTKELREKYGVGELKPDQRQVA